MPEIPAKLRFSGTLVAYYILCPRKAWLFYYGLGMEHTSELVEIGKLISQESYPRREHEIAIDNTIVLDWVDYTNKVVHEVKKSRAAEEAHIWQMKYYLWYLEQRGLPGFSGQINYPRLKRLINVSLSDHDKKEIELALEKISELLIKTTPPPPEKKSICKRCAYFEFCWI